MPARRTKLTLVFIAFAIAATFAHICVLPGHVHTSPSVTESHANDEPASDHHDAPDDSLYVESCDAVRTAGFAPAPPIVVAAAGIIASAEVAVHVGARAVAATAPRASPPLYLSHRALLI